MDRRLRLYGSPRKRCRRSRSHPSRHPGPAVWSPAPWRTPLKTGAHDAQSERSSVKFLCGGEALRFSTGCKWHGPWIKCRLMYLSLTEVAVLSLA